MHDPSPAGTSSGRPDRVHRADLARAVRLLREFRYEQPDPARFYTALADDSAAQLASFAPMSGATMLDVGGGPGYFRDAFEAAGATYFALDADVGELSGRGEIGRRTVIGDGTRLPFADDSFDICYSSNVLEHVPEPWRMAAEMVRVTRPGGTVFLELHGVVGTVGWTRDVAVALPRRPSSATSLRQTAWSRAQEQVRRVVVRRDRPRRVGVGPVHVRVPARRQRRGGPSALPPEVGLEGPQRPRAA